MNRLTATAGITVGLVLVGGPAWAYLGAQAQVGQKVTAGSLAKPSAPTVVADGGTVSVSWTASTAAASYTVSRGDTQVCSVTSLTCQDTSVPSGRWTYTVTPHLKKWVGPTSNGSASVLVSNATVALSDVLVSVNGGTAVATVDGFPAGDAITYCVDAAPCTALAPGLVIPAGLTAGNHTIVGTSSSGVQATSAPFQVLSGDVTSITVTGTPGSASVGKELSPQPVVSLFDEAHNALTSSTAVIDLGLADGTSHLTGCNRVGAITTFPATYSGCALAAAGAGQKIKASIRGTDVSAVSTAIDVATDAAPLVSRISVTGEGVVCEESRLTCTAPRLFKPPVTLGVQIVNLDGLVATLAQDVTVTAGTTSLAFAAGPSAVKQVEAAPSNRFTAAYKPLVITATVDGTTYTTTVSFTGDVVS